MNIFLEFIYGERSKWVCAVLVVFMLAFEMGFRTGAFQQRTKDSMDVARIALYCSISEPIDSLTLTVPDTSLWPHVGILTKASYKTHEMFLDKDSFALAEILRRAKLTTHAHIEKVYYEPSDLAPSIFQMLLKK